MGHSGLLDRNMDPLRTADQSCLEMVDMQLSYGSHVMSPASRTGEAASRPGLRQRRGAMRRRMTEPTALPALPRPAAMPAWPTLPPGNPWAGDALDARRHGVLVLDVLRPRGNAFLARGAEAMRSVLSFAFDPVLERPPLARPADAWLARIRPPEGAPATDPRRRPFVVVDPRGEEAACSAAKGRCSREGRRPGGAWTVIRAERRADHGLAPCCVA